MRRLSLPLAVAFVFLSLPAVCASGSRPAFRDTVSVLVIGDVMMHSRQMEYDCSTFLKYVAPRMREADFCIANMEFPLGGKPYAGYPAFSVPDYYADYVASCGVNVFLMANNHILDRGPAGLKRTADRYSRLADSLGIGYAGLNNQTLYLKKADMMVALINFTYGTNSTVEGEMKVNRMDRAAVGEEIECAAEDADFVVALPHWGDEYVLRHNQVQEEWASWLVSEGVDAIVGCHPHVVQDSTHIDGVPVIFSVGNAVSNMSAINTRLELAVTLRFVHDWTTDKVRMLEPQLDFMWCTLPGTLTDSYATIFVDEWIGRRDEWKQPSDYDNMMTTLKRVRSETGIGAE